MFSKKVVYIFLFRRASGAGLVRQTHRLRDQAGGGVRGKQSYQEPGDAESPPHSRGHLQVRHPRVSLIFKIYRRPLISLPIGRPRL